MDSLQQYSILILLLPLLGAVLAGALGPRLLKGATHWVVILAVGGAAYCAYQLFEVYTHLAVHTHEPVQLVIYDWIGMGGPTSWLTVNFRIDPLALVMLLTVTFIATWIVVYARDYMRHHHHPERGYERFFAFLGLFVFSMCALVLGGNFLLLYLGWEAVGLCSYLLIGFYYDKPAAAAAAMKAFLVNRIGDFGFGLGILLIYLKCGSLDYDYVLSSAGITALGDWAPGIALLLFCGAVGKSAQLPLYVWLPDAMEGPTPVSALIHAATMVTAGVYMVARCGAIFVTSEAVMTFVAAIGGITALFAATMALVQYDMKRILAYSTISQLGFMFLGLGVYAADAAVFHLMTHAFFKALLFLGAGSVMHAMGGIIDVREFGGLRKVLPWTCYTFVIGSLALAGFPMLSGFFSKDLILHQALEVQPLLGWLAVITAGLTAFYTFRMVLLAFWGPKRLPFGVHVHESGPWIIVPLLVLAIGAAGAGYYFHEKLPEFLVDMMTPFDVAFEHLPPGAVVHGLSHEEVGLLSGVVAIAGIAVAVLGYWIRPDWSRRWREESGWLYILVHNKYYVDEILATVLVRPLQQAAAVGSAVDRYLVDGLVWLVAAGPRLVGFILHRYQRGAMQGYGVMMAGGLAVIIFLVFIFARVLAAAN
ncbi:MAG: NADH-quinone oxidoreductase subunit L [Phycisphaerae bacterium]|nr:NADH-quinone oxidoreductase subunit L [Phycisphaerae bacterium]